MSDKEEGEISSNDNSFDDLSINCDSNDLENLTKNSSNSSSNYSSTKNASLEETERSLMELFTMDLDYDQQFNNDKSTKKVFTLWSDQLIAEQNKQLENPNEDLNKKKFTNKTNHVKNRLRTKKEQKKNLNDFSADIAYSLRENRKDIVLKIVKAIGYDKSTRLCKEAQKIYNTVGMLTPEGRKRTLGGCFFQLVKFKGNLDDATKKDIFYEPPTQKEKQLKNAKKRMKRLKSQEENQDNVFDILKNMNVIVSNQNNLIKKEQDSNQMNNLKMPNNNLLDIILKNQDMLNNQDILNNQNNNLINILKKNNNLLDMIKNQDNNLMDIIKKEEEDNLMNIKKEEDNLMNIKKEEDNLMNIKKEEDSENNLVDILKNMNINVRFN